jgi:hypothetical protein
MGMFLQILVIVSTVFVATVGFAMVMIGFNKLFDVIFGEK